MRAKIRITKGKKYVDVPLKIEELETAYKVMLLALAEEDFAAILEDNDMMEDLQSLQNKLVHVVSDILNGGRMYDGEAKKYHKNVYLIKKPKWKNDV